jgi:glycosyltransferase involved in cell wall biosynthesis
MALNYMFPDFSDLPGRRPVPRCYRRAIESCSELDVSIITPYYNTEAFFVETFISLQSQSLQNWEWVIVDDGSSDKESLNRLFEVVAKDERIKLIHQNNAGPASARNKSFINTVGRYICLLDSDDLIEPTYLEKCVWFLDSYPEFAFCNAYSVVFGAEEYLWTTGFERGNSHLQANSGPPISVIRREAFIDCGGFDESIRFGHEDWDFWMSMAKVGHWGYTIPEFLQWYRKRVNGRFEQIMQSDNVNDEFEKYIANKYEGLEKDFPQPVRRHPLPYETIETKSIVCNPLAANPNGRRVMFILPWMVTGGADRVNLDLIEGLTAKGHEVTVCATLAADHRWEHEFSRFTPDIFILPNFLHVSDYPRFLTYLIQSRQIDSVVITGSTLGYQFLPYLRAVSPDVAFVDMSHVEEPHWLNGGHPRFGTGYQDLLDLNITTTKHLADWMSEHGADGERIKVMYTGVRTTPCTNEDRCRVRAELDIPFNLPVIVFAGRLCEQKRPLMLAEILRNLNDQGLLFRALIIGEGELKHQFERLLAEYQLSDHVQMLGAIPHKRWLDVLAGCDILLMPSQYEGISIALLEAMAAGVVPVVAKVGGQNEIVSPDAGVLISHGDGEIKEYSDVLSRLVSNTLELQQMASNCKVIATTKLSWDGMVSTFLMILEEAHHLRLKIPRNSISSQLGLEIATQALECKRLGEAVDWLWNLNPQNIGDGAELLCTPAETQAVAKFAIVLSSTWLGHKLIRNRFLRVIGRWTMRRFSNSNVVN